VGVRLVRYADDMVLLARTEQEAQKAWDLLKGQLGAFPICQQASNESGVTAPHNVRKFGHRSH